MLAVRNGPGPAPSLAANGERPGLGIVGMQERVVLLGGSLSAGPTNDGGFLVAACLPLRDEVSVNGARSLEDSGDGGDMSLEERQ